VDERDIWATANMMIKQFGNDAPIEAAMRADELVGEGDLAGAAVWKRIKRSIELLSGPVPPGPLH
jgi:hypothetical protein